MLRNAARFFLTTQRRALTNSRREPFPTSIIQHLESDLFKSREAIKQLYELSRQSNVAMPKHIDEIVNEELKKHAENLEQEHDARLKRLVAKKEKLAMYHDLAVEQLKGAETTIVLETKAIKELQSESNTVDDEINALLSAQDPSIRNNM